MKMQILKKYILVVLCGAAFAACATNRKSGWESGDASSSQVSSAEAARLLSEAKSAWKLRQNQADLERALQRFEEYVKASPQDSDALVHLSRGHYLLADGHLENMDDKKRHWETGVSWGERALALNPEFRKKVVEEKIPLEKALDTVTPDQVPALYWTAVNLGKWAKNSGIGTVLKNRDRIKGMIERVQALNEGFFHGAVFRYWGTYYAVAPGFAGGSMDKSKQNFERAFKVAPNYLGSHVLFAENYATKKGDKEQFRKHLELVLKARPESLPDVIPEQMLEQKKAKKMLASMDSLF